MTDHDTPPEFRELRERAARLPKSIEPPRDLWPGIETRIAGTLPGRRETGGILPVEPSDQAEENCQHPVAQFHCLCGVNCRRKVQCKAQLQVGAELGGGTKRDPETADELWCCTTRISLCNIGGDGQRSTPNLIAQREVPIKRSLQRKSVGSLCQVATTLPGVKRL